MKGCFRLKDLSLRRPPPGGGQPQSHSRTGVGSGAGGNEPTSALFRSGCNGPEATIKSNSALSHILRRVVSG